jgi:DNA-binding transcriptional ArsR family regulator
MLVLADVAEVGTAEIPARFTPSLSVLTHETGLNESTVTRHLKALEKDGWVVRDRPSDAARARGERTRYRLDVPADVRADSTDPEPTSMQEASTVHAESTQGPRTPHGPSVHTAPSYKEEVRSSSDQVRSPDQRAARVADETVGQRVNRLAKTYTDRVKLSNFPAVAGVVRKAVNADVSDEKILAGLAQLADDSRAVTTDSLRYAIYGVPPSQFGTNGHKPSTTNLKVQAGLDLAAKLDGLDERKGIAR